MDVYTLRCSWGLCSTNHGARRYGDRQKSSADHSHDVPFFLYASCSNKNGRPSVPSTAISLRNAEHEMNGWREADYKLFISGCAKFIRERFNDDLKNATKALIEANLAKSEPHEFRDFFIEEQHEMMRIDHDRNQKSKKMAMAAMRPAAAR